MILYAVPLTGGGVGYGGFFALGIGVIAGSGDGDCAGGSGLIGFPFGSVSTITGWRIGFGVGFGDAECSHSQTIDAAII
jgi:hypothetical protein